MSSVTSDRLISLDLGQPLWDRFFMVAPLVIIGTKEADENYDLAPKHMAMPFGWDNYFGFICTPSHGTYQNIVREKAFSVSFPQPNQILLTSLTATARCENNQKPLLSILSTFPTTQIDSVYLEDSYLYLECHLDRIIEGFGDNSLIVGKIIAAQVKETALRRSDRDDQDILLDIPLLVYLSPGRYSIIDHSFSFPFHAQFHR
ncbi:flavin reductase [Cyanothece sp. BG0011]|uniref:flavin reductase n=1 Tax=Cyanothece sp. BG0011 TaxID=2082950 RepID=UPI000D1FC0E7|nr:flavin reductase [Cyanothece sp. BG0011]